MKGFIGSANIDTNSRLCMSSAVAAQTRAFGEDVVPASYEDLEQADLIVLVGSNTAWCHPIVYQRIQAARAARGTRLVVIDPRRTETCEGADLHLALRPGSDVALMNGLLAWCMQEGLVDKAYLAQCVDVPEGFWEALEQGHDLWSTASTCDLDPARLREFYELFAANPRTVTVFSQGINQSIRGTDQGNAIINLHLATGRIVASRARPLLDHRTAHHGRARSGRPCPRPLPRTWTSPLKTSRGWAGSGPRRAAAAGAQGRRPVPR
jgi:assimilatory nitrate reductase catalytic subunit